MRHRHIVGDVQLHPDRVVDGWCWAPSRPGARLRFELLADDRIVASGEASLPRPDLSVRGMSDTRHGFRLTLPAHAMDRGRAVLLSARERRSGVVFGRRLIEPDEPPAPEPALAAAKAALGLLSERLAAHPAIAPAPGSRLRAAFGELATVLPARATRRGADIAAARRLLGAGGEVALARPAAPNATLVVIPGDAAVPAVIAGLRTLAPATHAIGAEILLVDHGGDARMALLPSLAPGLSLLPTGGACSSALLGLAAGCARGDWLVALDEHCSGASLPWLLAQLGGQAIALATAPRAGAEALPRLRAPARSGVTLAVRRDFVRDGDTPLSLVARAAGDGTACVVLDEPWGLPQRAWRAAPAIL